MIDASDGRLWRCLLSSNYIWRYYPRSHLTSRWEIGCPSLDESVKREESEWKEEELKNKHDTWGPTLGENMKWKRGGIWSKIRTNNHDCRQPILSYAVSGSELLRLYNTPKRTSRSDWRSLIWFSLSRYSNLNVMTYNKHGKRPFSHDPKKQTCQWGSMLL